VRSIHRSPIFVAVLALSACASASESTFVRQNGTNPEPTKLAADAKDCGRVGTSAGGLTSGGLLGAAQGAYWGAAQGAADGGKSGNNPLAAAAGLVFGSVFGLFAGAFGAGSGDNYDLCMARHGYQRIDIEQAADASDAPVIVRRVLPALSEPNPDPYAALE